MLRFILDVLLLRKLIESKSVRTALLIFFLGALACGFIYAYIVFHAVSERNQAPHVYTHSTH
jgi:uncharacterized membrane protein